MADFETLLGGSNPGTFCANAVRSVLEIAFVNQDENAASEDPRHKDNWWAWQDWPLDGRQWERTTYGASKMKLDRSAVSEHKSRKDMTGLHGSKLQVERKLEGIMWDEDNPRLTLRSRGKFDLDLLKELSDGAGEQEKEDEDEDVPPFNSARRWLPATTMASNMALRHKWDAAVTQGNFLDNLSLSLNEQEMDQFQSERPFLPFLKHLLPNITHYLEEAIDVTTTAYFCTDAFATRDQQQAILEKTPEDGEGVASIRIRAEFTYFDPAYSEKVRAICVVAEAPFPNFAQDIDNRVAGFVFFQDDDMSDMPIALAPGKEESTDPVPSFCVTYVETCEAEFPGLTDTQKDSLLEDRALIVHRLMAQVAKPEYKSAFTPLQVRTTHYQDKHQIHGLASIPLLDRQFTTRRPDPRWPLVPPNSACLECGKGPKHQDETMRVPEDLLSCTGCGVRKFCSKECLAKSWRSPIWPHKYECNKARGLDEEHVGVSLRQTARGAMAQLCGTTPDEMERFAQRMMEGSGTPEAMDRTAATVEELRDQRDAAAEDTRNRRRNARTNKKKKKGKRK
jgi:hypothetical protein